MLQNQFSKFNNIIGWVVFAIALITYTLTLEPTVSFWDCGEYISTSANLEVGHPPGAPLFQMLGAFFAMFALSKTKIAFMVNFMSGLSSAFTILFLFWTSTNLLKKIATKTKELTHHAALAILGASSIGALAYAFSDSFWFNAVEAEVYAMSSFLMALLLWLALKWEARLEESLGNRWLLLICFVVGLSFGVHILTLLVIPSIVFIYLNKYYTKYNWKNFILANIIAIGVLIFVFKMLFPFTLKYFAVLELFFVNTVGLPFNSGSIIAAIILIGAIVFGLFITQKRKLYLANTAILSVVFVMIGFSCWLMLPIRSNANTLINENQPASARELLAYYNREQYGDANVFYDVYYSEKYADYQRDAYGDYILSDAKPNYEKDKKAGKYVVVNDYKKSVAEKSDKHKGFIPRMTNPNLEQNYKSIVGIPKKSQKRPSFSENIQFMVKYQFGYMYFRYLLWNFSGRQNDEQGMLNNDGNWMTGISFIDTALVGIQSNLPDDVANNKARNVYYGIPLILGIIGLIFFFEKDKRNFYHIFLFFAFTGFAVIFYTNPKPFEPRERDYAVVGSFYIFALWIGMGVYAIWNKLNEKFADKSKVFTPVVLGLFLLVCPILMASQNWDDHDRSGKYTAHFNAKSYLDSCDKDAIMFTIGDNDTFPLWYLQEIEHYRTDIKLINSSLLATNWYIDQMKRASYEAKPIPSQLEHDVYKTDAMNVAIHQELTDQEWDIKKFMAWMQSTDKRTFAKNRLGKENKFYPTNKIFVTVDKEKVVANGLVKAKDAHKIEDTLHIELPGYIQKNQILMLDILANNNWNQPIYFTGGSNAPSEYLWLQEYLQLDGLSLKLVPIKTTSETGIFGFGRIDADDMYEKVKNWDFGATEGIYHDVETRRNSITYRNNMSRLIEVLINQQEFDKAEEILDLSWEKFPIDIYQHHQVSLHFVEQYYLIGKVEKARRAAEKLLGIFRQKLLYLSQYDTDAIELHYASLEENIQLYRTVLGAVVKYEKDESYKKLQDNLFRDTLLMFDFLTAE